MNWIPVESSQISHLGYEPEAEYPLGIKFKPNKKQAAAGQPGSIYEYANVTPETFMGFLNAKNDPLYDFSIGKFFEQRIKNRPDLYQYRRVEQKVDMGPVNTATDEPAINPAWREKETDL